MCWVVIVDMQIVLLFEAMTKYEILMKFQELDETLVKLCILVDSIQRPLLAEYHSGQFYKRKQQISVRL